MLNEHRGGEAAEQKVSRRRRGPATARGTPAARSPAGSTPTGPRSVNTQDYGIFRTAFGKRTGQAGFDVAVDFDGNGIINTLDYGQFRTRFGKSFTDAIGLA